MNTLFNNPITDAVVRMGMRIGLVAVMSVGVWVLANAVDITVWALRH